MSARGYALHIVYIHVPLLTFTAPQSYFPAPAYLPQTFHPLYHLAKINPCQFQLHFVSATEPNLVRGCGDVTFVARASTANPSALDARLGPQHARPRSPQTKFPSRTTTDESERSSRSHPTFVCRQTRFTKYRRRTRRQSYGCRSTRSGIC